MWVGVLCEVVGVLCEGGGGGAVWGWGCYVGVGVLCEGGGAV